MSSSFTYFLFTYSIKIAPFFRDISSVPRSFRPMHDRKCAKYDTRRTGNVTSLTGNAISLVDWTTRKTYSSSASAKFMIHCLLLLTTEENETTRVKRVSRTLIFSICKYYSSRRVTRCEERPRLSRHFTNFIFRALLFYVIAWKFSRGGVRRAIVPNKIAHVSANCELQLRAVTIDREIKRFEEISKNYLEKCIAYIYILKVLVEFSFDDDTSYKKPLFISLSLSSLPRYKNSLSFTRDFKNVIFFNLVKYLHILF